MEALPGELWDLTLSFLSLPVHSAFADQRCVDVVMVGGRGRRGGGGGGGGVWWWAESSKQDMPAARYSKGDIISVQIGVRDVNTAASPPAPAWSRYMQYFHISTWPLPIHCHHHHHSAHRPLLCVSHVSDELMHFFTTNAKSCVG
jgi:hypothetical protein